MPGPTNFTTTPPIRRRRHEPRKKKKGISMTKASKVLVVGGGVGGLAVAIGLHQKGIAVEVVERDKDWKVYHVGIIVQANFVRALNVLGIGDDAVKAGYAYRGARFMDLDGNVLKELPGDTAVDGLPSDLGLTRPALHKVLTEKVLELGIPVRLGVSFETLADRVDGVDVTFTDGSAGSYDLVIGADGNYSAVRKVLWPEATPKFTGQGVWRYNVPRPQDLDWSDIYVGKAKGKAGYCPLTPEEMYIFAVSCPRRWPTRCAPGWMASAASSARQPGTSPIRRWWSIGRWKPASCPTRGTRDVSC